MAARSKRGKKFERKGGFVIVTGRGTINLHWLIAACKRRTNGVNVHSLLGDIYFKMGEATKAINEYMLTIKQCAEGESLYNRITICEKVSWVFQFLVTVKKKDLPEDYQISNRQLLSSRV